MTTDTPGEDAIERRCRDDAERFLRVMVTKSHEAALDDLVAMMMTVYRIGLDEGGTIVGKAFLDSQQKRQNRWTEAFNFVRQFGSPNQKPLARAFALATGKPQSHWLNPRCRAEEVMFEADAILRDPSHELHDRLKAAMAKLSAESSRFRPHRAGGS